MKTQFDHRVRMVSLNNLHAMCLRISGTAHVYQVDKVSRSRCTVSYSNPDEYGRSRPMFAVFPAVPGFEEDNPLIVLHGLRYYGNDADHQDFILLFECPPLFRSGSAWRTEGEIKIDQLIAALPDGLTEEHVNRAIRQVAKVNNNDWELARKSIAVTEPNVIRQLSEMLEYIA